MGCISLLSGQPMLSSALHPAPPVYARTPYIREDRPAVESAVIEEEEDGHDDEDYELDDIYVRTKFLESWLWTEVQLPEEPKADGYD